MKPLVPLTLSLSLLHATGAWAEGDVLEEIVVTSQRRAESLQDVPTAITAVSGEALANRHLQGNADLASQVPSLSFYVQGPGESTLAIRGLGTSYGLAPAVSYYVNETPLDIRTDGTAGVPDIDFFDVERVEVLRGPQGTLYGSSSMGGALRILTAQPDPDAFAMSAQAGGSTMEGGGSGYLMKSAVNVPLAENAAIRMVAGFEHLGGYIDRAAPGDYNEARPELPITARRINDANLTSGRILGLWKPTDTLSVKPSILFSKIDADSNSQYHTNLPERTTAATYASPSKSRLVVGNLTLEQEFGFAQLMSSTSVLSRDVDNQDDYSLLLTNLAPAFGVSQSINYPTLHVLESNNDGFIQELRLTSPADGRLRWVAGLYFSRFEQHSTEIIDSSAFAAEIGQTDSSNIYSFEQKLVERQSAVFADLTYEILPNFEVTAGARYYELRDSLENTQVGVLAAPNQPLVRAKATGTSPRFVLTYKPTDDVTLYGTAARGYRPGGPNVGLAEGIGCALTDAYSPFYDPDAVWNYEVGAKTELWQRRMSINVAAYRIDWNDVQQAVVDPGCGYIIVANVGTATSEGVEAEINFMPFESLLLSAGGSYTRAEFESITEVYRAGSAVQPGDPLPDVPRQKWSLAGEYTFELAGGRTGFLRADWAHIGEVPTGFTEVNMRPAYDTLGASLGMRLDRYEVSVYGRNLTNSNGILSIENGATDSFSDVFRTHISTPPRTVGVDVRVQFK
jgi:iron complex outermembrane recepter protein